MSACLPQLTKATFVQSEESMTKSDAIRIVAAKSGMGEQKVRVLLNELSVLPVASCPQWFCSGHSSHGKLDPH